MEPRVTTPRVLPLSPEDWTPEQAVILRPVYEQGQVYNNLGTMAQHPAAFEKLMAWGGHIIKGTTLTPRDRELVILRTGWTCRSAYVWNQHVVIAQREGLSREEVDRVQEGPADPAWTQEDRLLLQAVDELLGDHFISQATWDALAAVRTTRQVMDIIFAAGTYAMTASLMNSLGVQLDDSFRQDDPASTRSGLVFGG